MHAALVAYEWLQRADPTDLTVIQRIVWLQLKGLQAVDLAYRTSAPLRSADPAALTGPMRETVAAVFISANQPSEAIRVLDAAPTSQHSAGFFIVRGRAFAAIGDGAEAVRSLTAATAIPRSPRENAEMGAAYHLIQGKP